MMQRLLVKIENSCFWMLITVLATLKQQQRSSNTCRSEATSSATIDLSNRLPGNYKNGRKSIASIAVNRSIPNALLPTSRSSKIADAYTNLQS
jgi:hypothetical protein